MTSPVPTVLLLADYHALGVITFAEREALELRFTTGLSYREAGAILRIQRWSVRDRVKSGLAKIAAYELGEGEG